MSTSMNASQAATCKLNALWLYNMSQIWKTRTQDSPMTKNKNNLKKDQLAWMPLRQQHPSWIHCASIFFTNSDCAQLGPSWFHLHKIKTWSPNKLILEYPKLHPPGSILVHHTCTCRDFFVFCMLACMKIKDLYLAVGPEILHRVGYTACSLQVWQRILKRCIEFDVKPRLAKNEHQNVPRSSKTVQRFFLNPSRKCRMNM